MIFGLAATMTQTPGFAEPNRAYALEPARFDDLPGFAEDSIGEAYKAFLRSCAVMTQNGAPLRGGVAPPAALKTICRAAMAGEGKGDPRGFFQTRFSAFRVRPNTQKAGFFTGYYQPQTRGSLTKSKDFSIPVYPRPDELVALTPQETKGTLAGLTAARRGPDGLLQPFPDRAAIDDGALKGLRPLVYLSNSVELFLSQVQGSARVSLDDGRIFKLTYAGRNGYPYTSIGKILVDRGDVPLAEMTMTRLKSWLRENGLSPGAPGAALMRQNRSYVFFSGAFETKNDLGPLGAQGAPLTKLRSVAVDRSIWPYGTPVFIDALLPWQSPAPTPFRRLAIAQDTGSAILGPARADIFFGAGPQAGERAGEIRHPGDFYVLLPRERADR